MSLLSLIGPERLRGFALWALRLLEENLDTDLKARLEKYRQDRASLEQQATTVLAEIGQREAHVRQLTLQRSALEQSIVSKEASIQQLKQEVERIDEEPSKVDSLSTSDVLHADLRRRD